MTREPVGFQSKDQSLRGSGIRTWRILVRRLDEQLAEWLAAFPAVSIAQARFAGEMQQTEDVVECLSRRYHDLVVRKRRDSTGGSGSLLYLDTMVADDLVPFLDLPAFAVGALTLKTAESWADILTAILHGQVAWCPEDHGPGLLVDISHPPHRAIDRPETEQAIRGPQEAFTELAYLQVAQVRNRLPSPDLVVERHQIGRRAPTTVHLLFLEDLARPDLVDRVREEVTTLTLDALTNATRLGSALTASAWSIFPTVRYSERVDFVTLQLEQGKVALMVAGDPFVITLPTSLMDFYRTSGDYTTPWYDASFLRMVRLAAWAFGIYLPAVYIALTEVNPDLISPKLFDLVAGSHTGLPFTPLVEVVVMILVIEILREAAVRLPKVVASTIGTVGAIVVGTAVVKAGFVSPQIIVVMTFTALSLFSAPTYELMATWRLVSWLMLMAGFLFGIYGLVLATLWISGELVTLTSFGVPYLTPWAPWRPKDLANSLWRVPWVFLTRRSTGSRAAELRWGQPPHE